MDLCEICGEPVMKGQKVCEHCVDKVGAYEEESSFSAEDFRKDSE